MSKKVYLIRAAQFYKIGISHNITKRLGAVQTGCPIKCEYVGYFPSSSPEQLEKDLHLAFQDFKTWGEWFDLGDDNIRKLITDWNLKHVVNPYAETTQETERTSQSVALKDARSITSQVNEAVRVFEQCFPGQTPTDHGRQDLRKLISKYGFNAIAESIKHLSEKVERSKFWDKLPYACKTYAKYNRHVSDKLWSLYFKICDVLDRSEASVMLTFGMDNNLDENERFFAVVDYYLEFSGDHETEVSMLDYLKAVMPVIQNTYQDGQEVH